MIFVNKILLQSNCLENKRINEKRAFVWRLGSVNYYKCKEFQ